MSESAQDTCRSCARVQDDMNKLFNGKKANAFVAKFKEKFGSALLATLPATAFLPDTVRVDFTLEPLEPKSTVKTKLQKLVHNVLQVRGNISLSKVLEAIEAQVESVYDISNFKNDAEKIDAMIGLIEDNERFRGKRKTLVHKIPQCLTFTTLLQI